MKSKTSAALILLATFALGATAGGIGYRLAQRRVAAVEDRHPNPRNAPGHLVNEMAVGLNMDAAQKAKLEEIVGRSRERYRSLSEQFRPQYDAIRNETRQEIRQILRALCDLEIGIRLTSKSPKPQKISNDLFMRSAHMCGTARATVTAPTRSAPASSSSRAALPSVAPVVITSSTRRTRLPAMSSGRGHRNAPRTLCMRSGLVNPTWGGVYRVLRKRSRASGIASSCDAELARSSD
jgi:hypothetical protein